MISQGVELLVFFDSQTGTEAACQQYAAQVEVDPSRMIIDQNFSLSAGALETYTGSGISLPWDGILDPQGMIYYWTWNEGGTPEAAVEELLAPPTPGLPGGK